MNKVRRAALREIIDKIADAKDALEMLKDEEEEYRDNMPENLQGSGIKPPMKLATLCMKPSASLKRRATISKPPWANSAQQKKPAGGKTSAGFLSESVKNRSVLF